jgi:hypothetical protein
MAVFVKFCCTLMREGERKCFVGSPLWARLCMSEEGS